MMPSKMCLPSTKLDCSKPIMMGRIGFNMLAIIFEIILFMALHIDIGLNLPGASAPSKLGIRVKNVALKALGTP